VKKAVKNCYCKLPIASEHDVAATAFSNFQFPIFDFRFSLFCNFDFAHADGRWKLETKN
jgi:hypothetical protein